MIGPAPMCVDCDRYDRETGACAAYPEGIPVEFIMNEWDHRFPKPGDHGLQFVPRSGEVRPQEWWPDERGDRS